jgi:hypothetical protein
MEIIERDSFLWSYLPSEIRGLFEDGEIILSFVQRHRETSSEISDYSFLVFPFSKGYEGFLKKFLLDAGLIREDEYYGDDIRIGRILNPGFIHENGNVFNKICDRSPEGKHVSNTLWSVWKRGRNSVFHYFPHNYKKLTYDEALDIINEIIGAMNSAMDHCRVQKRTG